MSVIQMDFAEIFSLFEQNEVQAAHFSLPFKLRAFGQKIMFIQLLLPASLEFFEKNY